MNEVIRTRMYVSALSSITIDAMKMKNIIRATTPGKVKQVLVATGQSTQHRQALVEFE